MVPERHVPGDARPHEAEWGQGRGSWEEGETGVRWPLSRGWGTPEREGLQVGEGGVSFPSHPSVFSHSHFPNSPVLPGCHGNRSCQARSPRKPRARLSPLPITGVPPPTPSSSGVEGGRGNGGGENSDSRPREGAQTYIQRAPPPRKPPSSAPQLDTQRLPDVLPPPSLGGGDPPTQN